MLTSTTGSPDGMTTFYFEQGKKYEIPDELAAIFLKFGWAEEDKESIIELKSARTNEIALKGSRRRRRRIERKS